MGRVGAGIATSLLTCCVVRAPISLVLFPYVTTARHRQYGGNCRVPRSYGCKDLSLSVACYFSPFLTHIRHCCIFANRKTHPIPPCRGGRVVQPTTCPHRQDIILRPRVAQECAPLTRHRWKFSPSSIDLVRPAGRVRGGSSNPLIY